VAVVLLFAQAREAAGTSSVEVAADTVAGAVAHLGERFGPALAEIVAASRIWCNGEPVEGHTPIGAGDEVAVLPPVSGG